MLKQFKKLALGMLVGAFLFSTQIMSATPLQDYDLGREVVVAYLEGQKAGEDVSKYFCNSGDTVTFFNVQDYEFRRWQSDNFECKIWVRVRSTNKGGQQINQTWQITTRSRGNGTCITTVYKA